MATFSHVLKLDAATIQGRLLFEGSVYYTEAPIQSRRTSEFNYVSVLERFFQHAQLQALASCSHVSYTQGVRHFKRSRTKFQNHLISLKSL